MKLVKTASGKKKIKISRKEWTDLGKKAGWLSKKAQYDEPSDSNANEKSIDYDDLLWELGQLGFAWKKPIDKLHVMDIVDVLKDAGEVGLERYLKVRHDLPYGDARSVIRFLKYKI